MSNNIYSKKENKLVANFNKRKNITWNNRNVKIKELSSIQKELKHLEKEEKVIIPVRIAKIINKNIEVEFNKNLQLEDISIIVEFSDESLSILTPTKIDCDTSVLGKRLATVYYDNLTKDIEITVIRPKA